MQIYFISQSEVIVKEVLFGLLFVIIIKTNLLRLLEYFIHAFNYIYSALVEFAKMFLHILS